MPSHILVNKLGLTYKGTVGLSTATLPDVCKTPSPGGPVPIPYPNFADQGSLDKGSTTVFAKGKMIATKGSEYTNSMGDEAGTAGGVTSSTFKKETAWITYSFDVKVDGQNACRHTDKKFHNHKNTVDLAGNIDPPAALGACTKEKLEELADYCNRQVNCKEGPCPETPKGQECTTLGTKKHKCCEEAIKKHAEEHPECGIEAEVAYNKKTGDRLPPDTANNARSKANKSYDRHKKKYGKASAKKKKVWIKAFRRAGGRNTFIADVVMPDAAYDFKFNCASLKDFPPAKRMSDTQRDLYTQCTGQPGEVIAKDGRDCSSCAG